MHIRKIKLDEDWLSRNVRPKLYKNLKNSEVKGRLDLLSGEEIDLPITLQKIEKTRCYKVGMNSTVTALIGREKNCEFNVPLSLLDEEGEEYWLVTDNDKIKENEATHGALFRSQEQAEEFAQMYPNLRDFCQSKPFREAPIYLAMSEATYGHFERELKHYQEIKNAKEKGKERSKQSVESLSLLEAEYLPSRPVLGTYYFFTLNEIQSRFYMPDNSQIRLIAFSPSVTPEILIKYFPISLWVHGELIRLGNEGETVAKIEIPPQLFKVPVSSTGFFGKIKEMIGLKAKEEKQQPPAASGASLQEAQPPLPSIRYLVDKGLYNNNSHSEKEDDQPAQQCAESAAFL